MSRYPIVHKSETGVRIGRHEYDKLINHLLRRCRRGAALVSVLWETGAKAKDVLALKASDIAVDAGEHTISISLPGFIRVFEFRPPTVEYPSRSFGCLVAEYISDKEGRLFHISPQMLRLIVRDAGIEVLGYPLCLHNMKRTPKALRFIKYNSKILMRHFNG